ncbi:MAG: leucine-rich repeat protein [Ruminococcus sp.]|nr:leucine-rich repeat protein [Ruminococcus sp.]
MKKFVSLLLAFVMIMSVFTVVPFEVGAAQTDVARVSYTSGDYTYTVLSDGTAEITDYTGSATTLSIPSILGGYKVSSIGYCAFSPCYSLTSITIPNSVTSIGSCAFNNCNSLTSIKVDSNNKYYDSRDNCNAIIETSSNTLIAGCKNTVVPNGVTSIGDFAFSTCSSLTSITIPSSVTSIGDYAFRDCTNLTSITIPDSVTSIGDYAFFYCDSLTSITIPDSVTSIGDFAFSGCYSLTSITIPNSVTSIGWYAFNSCYSLKSITIPDSVTSIGDYAFYCCTSLTSITIPNSVTSIGWYAFSSCYSLKSITIPNSVISIGEFTFENCYSLTSITIPDSVTSIGESAFRYCDSLESIIIPDSVTSIGDYAFYGCDNLTLYVYEDSYAHEYAKEYDIPYEIIGNGNISFIDKGMRVYSDSNNLSVDKGKTIKIGVGVIDSGKESIDVSQVTFSIADTSIVKPLESKIVDNVFFVEFEALKCGTTLVTFSDSLTGFTAEIPVNVYSASSSAFTLNSIGESFDGYQLTSIAKVCGLSMDNYSYSVDENTGEATLSFNVYNSSFTYGAVEVYSADGKLVNAAIIDKYSYNSTSMKSIFFDNFCYLIGDVYEGNLFSPTYYRSQIRSKKTSVSVIVPKGGYINITLDAYTSPVVNIANSIDLLLQTGELAGDLNGYKAQEKEFVSALTDKVVEDILVDAVDPAKTAKKLFKNVAKDTFMTKETLGNFVDTYSKNFYEVTHSFDLVTDLAKGFTFGTAEEILLTFTGGYKYLFEAFFTTGKITELMVQYQDMIDSKDSGTVTIQNQVGPKRTNSDITVECKTNFTDDTALKVFRVTPDSDLLNSIKESDPTGYSVIRNSLSYTYNITMIKNGEETQPQDEVTVYIPIPEELKTFSVRGDVKVYRMEEDGTMTDMSAKIDGEYLVFNTTHFSLYSVVGVDSLGGIISDMLDYTFETYEDGTATLVKYNGKDTEIAIPSVYDGYVVTAIGADAFSESSNITLIEIPDSVIDIADGVFEDLNCTIGVFADSYAYEYVVANEIKHIVIDKLPDYILGDVDGDGKVSIMDATEIQRHIAQLTTITDDRLSCADANKDGQVNVLDATHIQRFIAQLIPEL